MNTYDNKYGFDANADAIQSFHRQRVMFAVKNGSLWIAAEGSPDTHAVWFERLGWISPDDDSSMEQLTRGYVDRTGIYAYTGYGFRVTERVERELKMHLPAIVAKLNVPPSTQVYLGLTPNTDNATWTPRQCLGTVESCTPKSACDPT